MRRVLVTGGRDYADANRLRLCLDVLHDGEGVAVVIHGDARGADRLAARWAEDHRVPAIACPARWAVFGKRAGPIRNSAMLSEFAPDLVLAFPGGAGTADMVAKAHAAGVDVVVVKA